jgi:hypothetical protein
MLINKNVIKLSSALAILVAMSTNSMAGGDFAIGAKIGSTGLGIEARAAITENLFGRFGVNYLEVSPDLKNKSKDSLHYRSKATILTAPLMVDFHPMSDSGFRLSAGIAYNGCNISASATPTGSIKVNNKNYNAAEFGSIKAKLVLGNKIAPVFSIGYDNSLISDSAFSFNAELGAMYLGNPKVKVSATGPAKNHKQELSDLEKDVNSKLGNIKKYFRWYPILTVGFKYSF